MKKSLMAKNEIPQLPSKSGNVQSLSPDSGSTGWNPARSCRNLA
jgi:hypothetical protein